MAIMTFQEWVTYYEAARRSFSRTLGKYGPEFVDKPVATMTAWRGELIDGDGRPYPETVRRKLNDDANRRLVTNLKRRGLSSFPVVGAGQEADKLGEITVNKENSVIVQPVGDMGEQEFLDHIRQLLFNPTGEREPGPFAHTQWGALVKLPSFPEAFLLYHKGEKPSGPQDYTAIEPLGRSTVPRLKQEPTYSQMKYGPRADPTMVDAYDRPGDVGNLPSGTKKPGADLPGRRYTIKDRSQP
jgi:hypothetical protein